jgi:hypothetical protein
MSTLSRFQLDLTPAELDSIERWSGFAGFRTKKEFLLNAFTLFQWAAKQVMLGRTICALNESTGEVRHLEMPALAAIAENNPPPSFLTPEEVRRRTAQPGRPFSEFLATLKEPAGGPMDRHLERRDEQRTGQAAPPESEPLASHHPGVGQDR